MGKRSLLAGIAVVLCVSLLWLSIGISKIFSFPYTPFTSFPQHKDYLGDLSCLMLGMRRIAADIAWVQLMQYYARPRLSKEEELEVEFRMLLNKEDVKKKYRHDFNKRVGYHELYDRALRIIHIDPYFHYVYLYAAGALAWNLDRFDQANDILKRGLAIDPTYWRFSMYIGAIAYKEQGEFGKMAGLLEEVITYPDCPNLIKSILANYYRKSGQSYKALELWLHILDTRDESYEKRARAQIEEIRAVLNIQ